MNQKGSKQTPSSFDIWMENAIKLGWILMGAAVVTNLFKLL